MNRLTRTILLNQAKIEYNLLLEIIKRQLLEGKNNSDEMQLLRSIDQKIDFLKQNPFYGESIQKKKIPDDYKVNNLWRVELTNYWRMLYTIKGDKLEIICFILDIFDHPKYNKKFGYKKK